MEETDSTITYVYGNFLYNIIHILLFVYRGSVRVD